MDSTGLTIRSTSVSILVLALLSGWAADATAQSGGEPSPTRQGFTMELSLGVGFQTINPEGDEYESDTSVGLSGLNLALGGFINPTIAIFFKFAGTVAFDEPEPGIDVTTISGVAGPIVQFWPVDFVKLWAGIGFGFVSVEASASYGGLVITAQDDDSGWGLMAGAAWVFWQNKRHALSIGLDWAPAFFEDGMIHNTGIVFAWQLL